MLGQKDRCILRTLSHADVCRYCLSQRLLFPRCMTSPIVLNQRDVASISQEGTSVRKMTFELGKSQYVSPVS